MNFFDVFIPWVVFAVLAVWLGHVDWEKLKAPKYDPDPFWKSVVLLSHFDAETKKLPSFMDNVFIITGDLDFPAVGELGVIYIVQRDNTVWRWDGTDYMQVVTIPPILKPEDYTCPREEATHVVLDDHAYPRLHYCNSYANAMLCMEALKKKFFEHGDDEAYFVVTEIKTRYEYVPIPPEVGDHYVGPN